MLATAEPPLYARRGALAVARSAHAPFTSVRGHDSYSLTMAAKSLEPSPARRRRCRAGAAGASPAPARRGCAPCPRPGRGPSGPDLLRLWINAGSEKRPRTGAGAGGSSTPSLLALLFAIVGLHVGRAHGYLRDRRRAPASAWTRRPLVGRYRGISSIFLALPVLGLPGAGLDRMAFLLAGYAIVFGIAILLAARRLALRAPGIPSR